MSAPAIVPLGIREPGPPKPIMIRKCTDDCCAVSPFPKRFTIVTFPDATETHTSYAAAIHAARAYIRKATQ